MKFYLAGLLGIVCCAPVSSLYDHRGSLDLVMFYLSACSRFTKKCLLSCYCVVSVCKCVNDAAFLCCRPGDKQRYRLAAFTGVLRWCLGVHVCMCTFVFTSGAKEKFPGASDSSLTFSSSFQSSLSPFFFFFFFHSQHSLRSGGGTSSPKANIHIKEYSTWSWITYEFIFPFAVLPLCARTRPPIGKDWHYYTI